MFENQAAFDEISGDLEVTAAIEGGVGAVRLGLPVRMPDGRLAASHPFTDVDAEWIEIYANDSRLSVLSEEI